MSESLADVVHEAVERAKADEECDPAAIMAAHPHGPGDACPVCGESWPCEPYRLAESL